MVQQNSQNKKIVAAGGLVGRIYGCESKDRGVSCYIRNNIVTADVYSEQVAGALCGFKFGDCIYDNTVNCNLNAPLTFIDGKNIYDFS